MDFLIKSIVYFGLIESARSFCILIPKPLASHASGDGREVLLNQGTMPGLWFPLQKQKLTPFQIELGPRE